MLRRRTPSDPGMEAGFGMVELTVALGVMSVAVMGMTGAMTVGIDVVGASRQRSAASAVATERIERIRNLSYDQVALFETPAHSDDPNDPDHAVSADGTTYTLPDGSVEPLVVDTVLGALKHIEDPVISGPTELYVHQYVTWVDDDLDGLADYKRVTVVTSWRRSLNAAVRSRVTTTTFVGRGSISVPQASPSPTPSASPSPTASPTPAPGGGSCPDDVQAPTETSMTIMAGAGAESGYTNSVSVQVRVRATDDCPDIVAELANENVDGAFVSVATLQSGVDATVAWSLPSGDGSKIVYARFRDAAGNVSSTSSGPIVLDQLQPTVPGNLRQVSCSIQGNDRSVTLTWDASSDANLSGYRLYRSIEAEAFQPVLTTGSQSASDVSPKTADSVRYLVKAYDHAGNESDASNVRTYAKNAC